MVVKMTKRKKAEVNDDITHEETMKRKRVVDEMMDMVADTKYCTIEFGLVSISGAGPRISQLVGKWYGHFVLSRHCICRESFGQSM
jgi:hypothetical protein